MSDKKGDDFLTPLGLGVLGAGALTLGIGIAFAAGPLREGPPLLELTLAEDQSARVELRPGVLQVETATTDVVVAPFGAAGSF